MEPDTMKRPDIGYLVGTSYPANFIGYQALTGYPAIAGYPANETGYYEKAGYAAQPNL